MADVGLLPLRALVDAHRDEIKAAVAAHKGRAVALFGSVARGEENEQSDIDFSSSSSRAARSSISFV